MSAPAQFCERLESRRLMAATYNFGTLTGYTAANASWNYAYTYSVKAGSTGSTSGSGNMAVTNRRSGTGAAAVWTLKADTDAAFGDTVKVFRADAQGLNVVKFQTGIATGKLTLNIAGTRLAPNTVTLGKTYSDTGTFTGTFSGSVANITAKGSTSGTTRATTRLVKTQSVTVPAGTFDTVNGTHTLALNGTLRLTIQGKSMTLGFSATYATTFWAVNKLGLVRQDETVKIKLSLGGKAQTIVISTNANLTSFTNPAYQRGLFSSAPVPASPGPVA